MFSRLVHRYYEPKTLAGAYFTCVHISAAINCTKHSFNYLKTSPSFPPFYLLNVSRGAERAICISRKLQVSVPLRSFRCVCAASDASAKREIERSKFATTFTVKIACQLSLWNGIITAVVIRCCGWSNLLFFSKFLKVLSFIHFLLCFVRWYIFKQWINKWITKKKFIS